MLILTLDPAAETIASMTAAVKNLLNLMVRTEARKGKLSKGRIV